MVSLATVGETVFDVLTCGDIVSFNLSAVLVCELKVTVGCVDLELSLVQAAKPIAIASAVKVNVVIFFTFVLFNMIRAINYKYSVFVLYLNYLKIFSIFYLGLVNINFLMH